MKLLLKNDLSELAKLADALENFGRENTIPARTVQELNLALDELVTNSLMHGFQETGDPIIEVELVRNGSRIEVTLQDNGTPFNPFDAPEPDTTAQLIDREIGGLGVFLVKQLMDEMRYVHEDGRNCVRLAKNLPSAAGE